VADTNQRIRFMANNLASLNVNAFTFSSELTGFEATNAFNNFRSSLWKTGGFFRVTAGVDDKLYFTLSGAKIATIAAADYTTPSSLATAIETAMNAVSSGFTVSYDQAGGSFKFTISNGSSFTLSLSIQTTPIWTKIGFTGVIDLVGTTIEAQEQRAHDPVTGEFITLDFGGILPVIFIGIISDVAQAFGISSTAVVTLEGNNINDFTSPPFSKVLEVTEAGILEFNITDPQATFRFWRLRFLDTSNSAQGPNLEFGNIYMGDFQTLTGANIQSGFIDTLDDPSKRSESEGGVLFFDKRTKFSRFSNLAIRFMLKDDKDIIKDVFRTVGTTEPFYIALDPLDTFSSTEDSREFTKFVIFDTEPRFTSQGSCFFSTVLNLREVV